MMQKIFTIGHSNLTFLKFTTLLQENHIQHIVDIRSIPYSRHAPWSNKSRLPDLLKPLNIHYSYLGNRLGGKKQIRDTKNKIIADQTKYDEAIQDLLKLADRARLSLLCAEGDPAKCHRQHIIAQTLMQKGINVIHILKNGDLIDAWVEDPSVDQPSLFG